MLISITNLTDDVRLGLWRIEEKLQDIDPAEFPAMAEATNEGRKLEIMAVYSLLREMTGSKDFQIEHDARRRPSLEGWHISISHTRGYAALMLSRKSQVAVDIEYTSDRVDRVASQFIRDDEPVETTRDRLVCWCAKETAYKYFTSHDLMYFDMRMGPVPADDRGKINVECLPIGKTLHIDYLILPEYTLTYAF